jgi:LacI family transcriptional regulator
MKMEDIARLAGVSKSAVSLALNGKPGISPETRQRIFQIAKEHNYQLKSRSLNADARTKSLTFLVFVNSGIVLEQYYQQPFFRELIYHIEERCRYHGYSLLFSAVDMNNFERDIGALAKAPHKDGVILLGTNLSREQIAAVTAKLPHSLVVLDTGCDTLPLHFVEINNVMGAYQAGIHLCELGHTDIGYIASNIKIHNFEERMKGFTAALREKGRKLSDNRIFSVAPTILSSQDALKDQLQSFLAAGHKMPTAFFCECDYIAISAIKTLTELEYRVPEDVSVVGFDNISEAIIVSPELTTVHVDKERLARLAVDLVIESINSEMRVKSKIRVDTELVARLSSAPPLVAAKRN